MAKTFPIKTIISAIDRISGPIRKIARGIRRGLAGAFRAAARAGSSLMRGLGRLAKGIALLGVVAVGAAVVGVKRLVDGYAEATDNLAKFSRRAGIAAQTYAELRFASDLAGISAAEFDKAMEKSTRAVGEARAGTGALVTFLNKTDRGFLKALKGTTSQSDALDLLLQKMISLKDPADRAAFGAAAFGRSGAKMALLVEKGSEGIAQAREEFRKYHGEISGKQLKDAEDYIDTQARMKAAISGVKATIGRELLPILRPLLENLAKWIAANRELIATRVREFIKGAVEAIKRIDFGAIAAGFRSFYEGVSKVVESLGGLQGVAIIAGTVIGISLVSSIVAATLALGPLGLALAAIAGAVLAIVAVMDELRAAARTTFSAVSDVVAATIKQTGGEVGITARNETVTRGADFTQQLNNLNAQRETARIAEQVRGEIVITLANAPTGTTVEAPKTAGPIKIKPRSTGERRI